MGMQIESKTLDSLIRVYGGVHNSLATYDRGRDPNELDHLIYQFTKLYCLVRLMTTSTNEALEEI